MDSLRKAAPALLLILSPLIAEVVSSSTYPVEFIQPLNFILLLGFYGVSALLIREARVRLGASYLTVLFFGMAYGVFEEGIAVKSFFDPEWPDLGPLAYYGRWLGVNWVWSVNLTIFHALISITTPILIVEAIFWRERFERWVSDRVMIYMLIVLGVVTLIFNVLATPYRPHPLHYALCVVLIGFFTYLGIRLRPPPLGKPLSPRVLAAVSFSWVIIYLFHMYLAPQFLPPGVAIITSGLLYLPIIYAVRDVSKYTAGSLEAASLALGTVASLTLFVLLVGVGEGDVNIASSGVVGAILTPILTYLVLRSRRRMTAVLSSDFISS